MKAVDYVSDGPEGASNSALSTHLPPSAVSVKITCGVSYKP